MEVILSIKPEYANKIFNGSKKFEFRRSIFKNKEVTKIIVYASSPISKIIGEFEIAKILHEDLKSLWKLTKQSSGITEKYYYDYFIGKENGFALEVKKVKLYKEVVCIKEVYGISPPQSFAYVKKSTKA
ncbi:ASCH domain-containing protein [Flavobacterium undicola]|uniref:ASCH domain-containing protein n=1 Tax=Flavobacterium undicola TaxID=1932779 RepID=UPI001376B3DD|nr:ASCH domain-containing protein [Flavobacterium undicola]MBA0884508.1 ASCH domain-containing protein [Flavobacterium undicola]